MNDCDDEDDIVELEKISFKTSLSKEISLYKEQIETQSEYMNIENLNQCQNFDVKKSNLYFLMWNIAVHLFLLLWYYLDLAIDAYTCYLYYKQSNFNYLWLTLIIVAMPVVVNIIEYLLKKLDDHENLKIKNIFLMVFLNIFMLDMLKKYINFIFNFNLLVYLHDIMNFFLKMHSVHNISLQMP